MQLNDAGLGQSSGNRQNLEGDATFGSSPMSAGVSGPPGNQSEMAAYFPIDDSCREESEKNQFRYNFCLSDWSSPSTHNLQPTPLSPLPSCETSVLQHIYPGSHGPIRLLSQFNQSAGEQLIDTSSGSTSGSVKNQSDYIPQSRSNPIAGSPLEYLANRIPVSQMNLFQSQPQSQSSSSFHVDTPSPSRPVIHQSFSVADPSQCFPNVPTPVATGSASWLRSISTSRSEPCLGTTNLSPSSTFPIFIGPQSETMSVLGPKLSSDRCNKDGDSSTSDRALRVFVWDLDETLIIFQSLLTGHFAHQYGKDPSLANSYGLQMEELIYHLAQTQFFYNELEDCDQVHIEDVRYDEPVGEFNFNPNNLDLAHDLDLMPNPLVSSATNESNYNVQGQTSASASDSSRPFVLRGGVDWMRRLALRYRRIGDTYEMYRRNVSALMGPSRSSRCFTLRTNLDVVTDRWLSLANKAVELIGARWDSVNLLVTSTQLVPALSKLLLYGLSGAFSIENVYSSTKVGKESCFERIASKFGRKSTFVVIGDGKEEEDAAKHMHWPFWRINSHSDIAALCHALEMGYL